MNSGTYLLLVAILIMWLPIICFALGVKIESAYLYPLAGFITGIIAAIVTQEVEDQKIEKF